MRPKLQMMWEAYYESRHVQKLVLPTSQGKAKFAFFQQTYEQSYIIMPNTQGT